MSAIPSGSSPSWNNTMRGRTTSHRPAAPHQTPPTAHPRQPRELLDALRGTAKPRNPQPDHRNHRLRRTQNRLGNPRLLPADEVGSVRPRNAPPEPRSISAFTSSRTTFSATSSRMPAAGTASASPRLIAMKPSSAMRKRTKRSLPNSSRLLNQSGGQTHLRHPPGQHPGRPSIPQRNRHRKTREPPLDLP